MEELDGEQPWGCQLRTESASCRGVDVMVQRKRRWSTAPGPLVMVANMVDGWGRRGDGRSSGRKKAWWRVEGCWALNGERGGRWRPAVEGHARPRCSRVVEAVAGGAAFAIAAANDSGAQRWQHR